jgi:hypothetical protein
MAADPCPTFLRAWTGKVGIHRLPSKARRDNYRGPLRETMNSFKHSEDRIMQSVVDETEEEMKILEEHEKYYRCFYYIKKAAQLYNANQPLAQT